MPGESAIVVAARHRLTWSCRTPWTSEVNPSTTVGRIANIGALHLPAQTSVTFGALAMEPGTPWFTCWRTHANERASEQSRTGSKRAGPRHCTHTGRPLVVAAKNAGA